MCVACVIKHNGADIFPDYEIIDLLELKGMLCSPQQPVRPEKTFDLINHRQPVSGGVKPAVPRARKYADLRVSPEADEPFVRFYRRLIRRDLVQISLKH